MPDIPGSDYGITADVLDLVHLLVQTDVMEVNIHQAKTHLSKLLRRTMQGEEIIIARAGVPIARLVGFEPKKTRRALDVDRGLYKVPEDFDAPLPPHIVALFTGNGPAKERHSLKPGRSKRS